MEIELSERQRALVESLEARTGRTATDVVLEAVDRVLAQEEWFRAQMQVGIDQIGKGEFLEEEEMDERGAGMLGS